MKETFGEVVNRLRSEVGLSMREVAQLAEVSNRTLEDYLSSGRANSPSLDMGFKIAKALGVDVNIFADCQFSGARGGAKKYRK